MKPILSCRHFTMLIGVISFFWNVYSVSAKPISQSVRPYQGLKADKLTTLSVIHGDDTAILVKSQNKWVTSKTGLPADAKRLEKLFSFIKNLEMRQHAIKGLSSPLEDSADPFGLSDKFKTVLIWADAKGKTTQAKIGVMLEPEIPDVDPEMAKHVHNPAYQKYFESLPVDPDSTYWQPISDSNIYVTPGNPGFINPVEHAWQDLSVFPDFNYESVSQVDVKWRDSTNQYVQYKIRRIDNITAEFVFPKKMSIPRQRAGDIYVRTPQFAVYEYVKSDDLNIKFADFENPDFVITVHLKGGKKFTLSSGRKLDGFYYAIHPKHRIPIKIVDWRIDPFKKTVEELLIPPPPEPEEDEVYENLHPDPHSTQPHSHDHAH
jgi:hypothetical protein